jgi:hypothetical protein
MTSDIHGVYLCPVLYGRGPGNEKVLLLATKFLDGWFKTVDQMYSRGDGRLRRNKNFAPDSHEFTQDDGSLNTTLKIKRNVIVGNINRRLRYVQGLNKR